MAITAYKMLKGATHSQLSQAAQLELALGNRVLMGTPWSRGGYLCQGVGTGTIDNGLVTNYYIITQANDEAFVTLLNTQLPAFQPFGNPVIHNSALYQVMGQIAPGTSSGTPGKTPVLRLGPNAVQWRYEGDNQWLDLVPLSAITGPVVQMRVYHDQIQYKLTVDVDWTTILMLSDIKGEPGPANSLSIGTVTKGDAAAEITGTPPSQTLNLTLPGYNPQAPVLREIETGVTYQHTDPDKPYTVTINVRTDENTTGAEKLELRIDSVSPDDESGFAVSVWESATGGAGGTLVADVPAGWYFRLNRLSGTNATIVSCFTQTSGN